MTCSTLKSIKHPATTLSTDLNSHIRFLTQSKDVIHQQGLKFLLESIHLDAIPRVIENVNIGPNGTGKGHNEFIGDAMYIYKLALAYALTKDIKYFNQYIQFQDGWNTGCKSFVGTNAPIECAWGGTCMVRAAEVMKHQTNAGLWTNEFARRFQYFLDLIIIPNLKLRYMEIRKWKNNWILSIQEALLQVSLYRDDVSNANIIISDYTKVITECLPQTSGRCNETQRDLIHTQFEIGSMVQICEMCWNQGIDVYSVNDNCVMRCMEYHAHILNGGVPNDVNKSDLKEVYFMPSVWDIGYNHYVQRQKESMPYTDILLRTKRNRPEMLTFNWGPGWLHYRQAQMSQYKL